MKISTVAEMRELDRRATADFGISAGILMENAGEAAYGVIRHEFGVKNRNFLVVSGGGNNGGDGFVVARKLHSNGAKVRVILLNNRDKYQGAAKQNLDIITKFLVEVREISSAADIENDIAWSDGVIDAIFGTGLDRNVEGVYRDVMQLINDSNKTIFALDIASGINGDSGQEMGISIKADYTITFGLPKTGNLLYPGFDRGGKLFVTHISFPPALYESSAIRLEIPSFAALPGRRADANKMDFGPILVIAGAVNYFWAPYASAYSFLKAGGGYVFLACPGSLTSLVAKKGKEIVFQPQPETQSGSISLRGKTQILELSHRVKMVIIGPGLSLNLETQQLVRELVNEIDKPLLIDGDGISAIAQSEEIIAKRTAPTILTPHLGEMVRITGKDKSEIEKHRVEVLRDRARRLNASIVLKGAHSLTGFPDGSVYVNVSGTTGGNSGMATAGSGDVLNGTIAAMYCLGLDFREAIRTGVFIHGLAGDFAARKKGPDGMTAKDILDNLPNAVLHYRENLGEIAENLYDTIFEV
jgi:ADP-dependent NAD(P)H-hydrate dehydratase / NAD(P)H-hydrate epimerase